MAARPDGDLNTFLVAIERIRPDVNEHGCRTSKSKCVRGGHDILRPAVSPRRQRVGWRRIRRRQRSLGELWGLIRPAAIGEQMPARPPAVVLSVALSLLADGVGKSLAQFPSSAQSIRTGSGTVTVSSDSPSASATGVRPKPKGTPARPAPAGDRKSRCSSCPNHLEEV